MKTDYFARTLTLAASLALQLGLLCFHSLGAPGDVDLSFDPGSGVNGVVNAAVVQPDGKVIIGGQFTLVRGLARTNIARLNADGSGDSSFISAPLDNPVYSLALQGDGKLLVGSEGYNFGLTRVNPDGTRDTNFNDNALEAINSADPYDLARVFTILVQLDGRILYGNETLLRLNPNGTLDNSFAAELSGYVYSAALQPDGKLIIGGYFNYPDNTSAYGIARLNANGSLDHSFDGTAGTNGLFNSIVLQPDGKVLVGGSWVRSDGTNSSSIARFNANGVLDVSFNCVTPPDVFAIALQSDGKVLLGGQFASINRQSRTNLARLNPDGSLDVNFQNGHGGVGGQPFLYPGTSINALFLQTNGTMVIGGAFTMVSGTNRDRVARLNADGNLDNSFDAGQGVDAPIGSLALQRDGKVLLGIGSAYAFVNGTNVTASARLNIDGSLDSSFVSDTNFHPDIGFNSGFFDSTVANSVAVQSDGKVIVSGETSHYDCDDGGCTVSYISFVHRLFANGSRDDGFDPIVETNSSYAPVDIVAVQPDGKVLVGGLFSSVKGTSRSRVARLDANGVPDMTFNAGTVNGEVGALALQPDGKVIIGGSFTSINGTNRNSIARLNGNGSLDLSFNPGSGANDAVFDVALQADGKILVGGNFTVLNGTSRNRIARLNSDGSLDSSFNPSTGADAGVFSIALQSDGKVFIGGYFLSVNGLMRPYAARLFGDSVASPPSLNIARSNASMILSWPTNALNFQLQESTNLSLANAWSPVVQSRVTNGAQISVTAPVSAGMKFFRLKSQ